MRSLADLARTQARSAELFSLYKLASGENL